MLRKVFHKSLDTNVSEFAVWITNGIREFEKTDEVDLHVVSPYPYLKSTIEEFDANGIHYHFFRNEDESLTKQLRNRFYRTTKDQYRKNRKQISRIIKKIQPDVVHLFGAENPHYSLGILDVPQNIVTIAQLQTLLNDPTFLENNKESRSFLYKSEVERQIIQRVNFVGTSALIYRDIIREKCKPNVCFVNTSLALFEPIVKEQTEKQFDFVYFASNISKAADLALEAFGTAYQENSNITIDIIGGFDANFKRQLDSIIQKYGISQAVVFEGSLPTHDDVLSQIRKARFALLPLRVDLTSGTIREAMSNGLPVITTDTGELGTQRLNRKRQNVLISPIGNHQALAENMIRLLNDRDLEDTLRQNAYLTRSKANSNEAVIQKYIKVYYACIENYRNHTSLPAELTEV